MKVAYIQGGTSTISQVGYQPKSCSLNLSDDNNNSYVVWSQINSSSAWENWVAPATNFGNTIQLSNTGQAVQLSNGQGKANMFGTSYVNNGGLPYHFNVPIGLGSSGLGGLQKTTPAQVFNSRGISLGNDTAQVLYLFGDVVVDGAAVPFVSIPDTFNSKKLDDVNALLQTKPFSLKSTSTVTFGDFTVAADSVEVKELLGDSGYVAFRAELLDASTNKVLATIKQSTIGSTKLSKYSQGGYNLNTGGISGSSVRIRITASTNIKNPSARPVDDYSTENIVAPASTQNLAMQQLDTVTTYASSQNYPNPFNPTTTIAYQLPKDGKVTIKIFDVIGREVTTLVDEFKPSGRYTVQFDASRLSSGIYFYSLRSGSYNVVKKMSLIK